MVPPLPAICSGVALARGCLDDARRGNRPLRRHVGRKPAHKHSGSEGAPAGSRLDCDAGREARGGHGGALPRRVVLPAVVGALHLPPLHLALHQPLESGSECGYLGSWESRNSGALPCARLEQGHLRAWWQRLHRPAATRGWAALWRARSASWCGAARRQAQPHTGKDPGGGSTRLNRAAKRATQAGRQQRRLQSLAPGCQGLTRDRGQALWAQVSRRQATWPSALLNMTQGCPHACTPPQLMPMTLMQARPPHRSCPGPQMHPRRACIRLLQRARPYPLTCDAAQVHDTKALTGKHGCSLRVQQAQPGPDQPAAGTVQANVQATASKLRSGCSCRGWRSVPPAPLAWQHAAPCVKEASTATAQLRVWPDSCLHCGGSAWLQASSKGDGQPLPGSHGGSCLEAAGQSRRQLDRGVRR